MLSTNSHQWEEDREEALRGLMGGCRGGGAWERRGGLEKCKLDKGEGQREAGELGKSPGHQICTPVGLYRLYLAQNSTNYNVLTSRFQGFNAF